jgi:hypothetical protein
MNETTKSITIKILLTIPAIVVGIISAIILLLKPAIDLWKEPNIKSYLIIPEEDKQENHTFM